MTTSISYEELDKFAGEVLPERAVMSTVVTPIVTPPTEGGGHWGGGGGHHNTTLSACQQVNTLAAGGLAGVYGLSPNAQTNTNQCIPAASSTF